MATRILSKNTAVISIWALSLIVTFSIGKNTAFRTHAHQTEQSNQSKQMIEKAKSSISDAAPGSRATSARSRLEASPIVRPGSTNAEIVQDIARHQDPLVRTNALLALIDTLAPDDFQDVVHAFRELGITDTRRGEYAMLLAAWAKVNPQEALTYAKENTGGGFARNTILAVWAGTNPDAAIAWAESNHDSEQEANPWLVGVIRGIAPQDIARATALMETMPRSRARGEALDSMVSLLMARGADEAKEWALGVEEDYLRSGAIAFTAESIARKSPEQAADWLGEQADVEALNRVSEDITQSWYRDDPEAAIAWVTTLPPDAMSEAAEGIIDQIVDQDPVQAAEWLSNLATQNPDANFDSSIRELVRGSARQDPELAAVWIGGLSNENDQTRSYHRLLGDWRRRDSPSAERLIEYNSETLPRSIQRRFNPGNAN